MTTHDAEPLSDAELALWRGFKHAGEAVRGRVAAEIAAATGLSDPDFGVLTRLADAGGRLRQSALAASMGWHRSRLSHHLTRMAERDLVAREGGGAGVEVVLTGPGAAMDHRARPVHAAAVRRHLLDRLGPGAHRDLQALLESLASDPGEP